MRSSHLPFKIFILPVTILVILFSAQNIFAQSGWQSTFTNNVFIINKIIKRDSLNYFAFSNSSKNYLKSTNGGNNWISSSEFVFDSIYTIRDGIFLNTNTGWIIGNSYYNGVIFKTSNAGKNWVKQYTGIYSSINNSINLIGQNTIWISTGNTPPYATLIKSTDAGNTWNKVLNPLTYRIAQVKFSDIDNGWIFATNGGFLSKTTNSGANWLLDTTFKNFSIYSIALLSQNECWILVRDASPASRYYHTTNGGQNWNLIYTNKNLMGELKFFDSQTGYAYAGESNVILKTTNGGNNWDSTYIISSQPVKVVLPLNRNEILAGGGQNVTFPPHDVNTHSNIVKTSNAGVNWIQNYYTRNYNFVGVHFKDNQNGLVIEEKGLIFKTTDGGNSWVKIYENLTFPMSIIKSLNDTNILIFRSNGNILRTSNYGDNWSEIITPVNDYVNKIDFFNSNTGFIMGSNPYLLKTINGGINWDSIRVPVNDIPFPGASGYSGMSFINENTGWLSAQGNLTIGGHGTVSINIIKKTTNGGLNWNIVYTSSSSSQLRRFKFFNENTGWTWLGTTLYQTSNSGSNWSVYNQNSTFTYSLLYMHNSLTGWMTGTDGPNDAICKTTNGGINWFLQVSKAGYNSNFVNMFIKDSNNAWVCGAMSSIYKTTNGGGEIISAINPTSSNIPDGYSLSQNYPNPFNPTTKINFDLKNSAFAMLRVYDITGREVKTLVNEKLSAGSYSYDFNASELPSGVYFYQLQTDGFVETKKMILLK